MNDFFINRGSCPVCKNLTGIELYRAPYTEDPLQSYLYSFYSFQDSTEFNYLQQQDYILMECPICDLIYQQEIPNDLLMHRIYDEWINPQKVFDLLEKKRRIDYFATRNSEIIRIVRFFDSPPADLKFLDYSMGWGHWCRIAQSFGCEIHGTEFSKFRIDHAKRSGLYVIDYDKIPNQKYDFINTEQVFEHLPDPRIILEHLVKGLKTNGVIKISVPNGWDIKKRLKKLNWSAPKGNIDSLNSIAPVEHINCFKNKSLVILAQEFGLEPIDIEIDKNDKKNGMRYKRYKKMLKSLLKPYYQRLRGKRISPAGNGTYLFFQKVKAE